MIRGRYAPSPTGRLHLGNLRTALVCWLQARLSGGEMLLRMDDLDQARVRPGSAEQILDDLRWLGLDWDGRPVTQSSREPIYAEAFEQLREADRLFPCICSRKDIRQAADTPDPESSETVYPGTCRPPNIDVNAAAGQPVAWRYWVDNQEITFEDELLGQQCVDLSASPGDFVVRRKDGVTAYQLASVVDDGLLGITDVVRGSDLATSSARQLALFDALGYPRPRFWHVPLMTDAHGAKLSKRDGSTSLEQYLSRSETPESVVGMLAHSVNLTETSEPVSADDLLQSLSVQSLRECLGSG